ncbi:hypothetical protein NHQ30_005817 [Ciborinia camelliae]|nr:hypothetical protein NHQ30_005817 [Ciborinia camelliae]
MTTVTTVLLGNEGAQHRLKEYKLVVNAIVSRASHKNFRVSDVVTAIPVPVTSKYPDEIWGLIYQFCDVDTLKILRLTSKRMSGIALRYLIEFILIFEFPLGEYSRYNPVMDSLISTCRKHTRSFTYKTVGLRSINTTKNEIAFENRCSLPQIHYLGNAPWQKLTHLRLDYLFIHPADLLKVLQINGRTLKTVTLYKPTLRGCRSWVRFFRTLRQYHAQGIMNLSTLDLKGWLQWTHSDSHMGVLSTEETVNGESYPYKVSWMIMRGKERDESGRKVWSKDPSKHTTLQKAMEKYVIEGGKFYWFRKDFTTYVGPLQGFAVAEEQVIDKHYPGYFTSPGGLPYPAGFYGVVTRRVLPRVTPGLPYPLPNYSLTLTGHVTSSAFQSWQLLTLRIMVKILAFNLLKKLRSAITSHSSSFFRLEASKGP